MQQPAPFGMRRETRDSMSMSTKPAKEGESASQKTHSDQPHFERAQLTCRIVSVGAPCRSICVITMVLAHA